MSEDLPLNAKSFMSLEDAFNDSRKYEFAILSYVSSPIGQDAGIWGRSIADETKITAAFRYIKQQDPNLRVWLDNISWKDRAIERYSFMPFRTLGAVYKYAKYTLAILEGADAWWMGELAMIADIPDNTEKFERWCNSDTLSRFKREVKESRYSYWNRAWILQEILQSQAIFYGSFEKDGHFKPLISGSQLATFLMIPIHNVLVASSEYRRLNNTNRPRLTTLEAMKHYMDYSVPPNVRSRFNIDYNYRFDLIKAITFKPYYARDRKNAFEAMAILLGCQAYPTEQALVQAVHHELIRLGQVPTSIFNSGRASQGILSSSWMPWKLANSNSTEELGRYFPSPIPCELLPSGGIGIVGKSLHCRLTAEVKGEELVWHVSIDGARRGTIDGQSIQAMEEQDCLLVWLETATFFLRSSQPLMDKSDSEDKSEDKNHSSPAFQAAPTYKLLGSITNQRNEVDLQTVDQSAWKVRYFAIN